MAGVPGQGNLDPLRPVMVPPATMAQHMQHPAIHQLPPHPQMAPQHPGFHPQSTAAPPQQQQQQQQPPIDAPVPMQAQMTPQPQPMHHALPAQQATPAQMGGGNQGQMTLQQQPAPFIKTSSTPGHSPPQTAQGTAPAGANNGPGPGSGPGSGPGTGNSNSNGHDNANSGSKSHGVNHQPNALVANNARSIKRPRPVKSCTECRKRKLRCDRLMPCSQCSKSQRLCRYASDPDSANFSENSDGESERPAKKQFASSAGSFLGISGIVGGGGGGGGGPGSSGDLSSMRPMGVLRNGEYVTLEDLVARLERLEQAVVAKSPARTDHSGSKMLNAASPKTIRQLTIKSDALRTRFFGQNSPRVLLNLFPQAKALLANRSNSSGLRDLFVSLENIHKMMQAELRQLITPIPVFVESILPIERRMTDILPPRDTCIPLLETYFQTSEVIFRFLHINSFKEKAEMYWQGKITLETHPYFLPQLLTAVAIGSRFSSKGYGLSREKTKGVHVPTACALVRSWLDGLRGKQLVDITTLQTELLLLHCQRLTSLTRDHDAWTQLGYVVRMAMTMGLHRDPSEYEKMPIFTGELRRRLWYSILDMDLHVSMLCNLPALVRDGDYTTKPALNIDDGGIYEGMTELPKGKPVEEPTDCQVHCYAAMTLPIRLRVSHVVHRIDNVRDYSEILDLGSKLEHYLEDINFVFPCHSLDTRGLNQLWHLRVIMDMHVRRPLLALYRPFALGVSDAPSEIVRAYLRSSMMILRYMDEIDPQTQHAPQAQDMYRQLLRQDIIQACFSLCFFVKNAITTPVRTGPTVTFDDDLPPLVSNDVWAPPRLITTVKSSLEFLIDGVSSLDINDIVSLSVVFWSVQSSDAKAEDVEKGLEHVRSVCMRNMNMSQDKQMSFTSQAALQAANQEVLQRQMQGHAMASAMGMSGHHGMTAQQQAQAQRAMVNAGMGGHTGLSPDPMVLEQFQIRPNMMMNMEQIPTGLLANPEFLQFWDLDNWSSMVPPGAPG